MLTLLQVFWYDYVFNPALVEGGVLANSVGKIIGTGETRGIGFLIILSGVGLIITALFVSKSKGIREMEKQKDTELIPTEQSI